MEEKEDTDLVQLLKPAVNASGIINRNGIFLFISTQIADLLNYKPCDLQGTDIFQLVEFDERLLLRACLGEVEANTTITLPPLCFLSGTGSRKTIEISLTPVADQGTAETVFLNLRAVNNKAEDERLKRVVAVEHANFFARHPWGIFHMTIDACIDRINPRITEDLGYTLQDVRNADLLNIFSPECRRSVFLMYYYALHHLQADTRDLRIFKRNGEPLHINFTIIPVVYENRTLEIYGIIKDISDRYELQESLRRTSIVADKSLNGVVIMNRDRKIEWVNKGFTLMNGYTPEEAKGHDPAFLLEVQGFNNEILQDINQQLAAGQVVKGEMLARKKDDTPYWVLVELTPVFNKNGKLERLISIHSDITEKKKAEHDLQQLADDLYRQNKELQQFAYIVSHNLRSPVACIVGLSTLLDLYRDDPETVADAIADLQKASGNLDAVIKDLSSILEISNSANRQLLKEEINVTDLLRQVITELEKVIKGVSAKIIIPENNCLACTNKAYLHSVFYNLISNAIKYRSEAQLEIAITITADESRVNFSFSDNGKGIDIVKYKEALFKPYSRFNHEVEGKGLGLFLVKSHVESLGGTISIESEVGKGTTFYFSITR